MVAVTTMTKFGTPKIKAMTKSLLELHYNRISRMCFLLNGRKFDYASKNAYRCGYNPKGIDVCVGNSKRTVNFNSVSLSPYSIIVTFDNNNIIIDPQSAKFSHKDYEKTAKKLFGEFNSVDNVLYYTEKALKSLLMDYSDQIKETLTQVAFY